MGLLDWNEDPEDFFSFPDFAQAELVSSNRTQISKEPLKQSFTSLSSTESDKSTRDRSSTMSTNRQDSFMIAMPTAKPHRRRRSTIPSKPVRPNYHRRSTSFDLFGDDSELQEAEPRIGFCDICLKHCAVHE